MSVSVSVFVSMCVCVCVCVCVSFFGGGERGIRAVAFVDREQFSVSDPLPKPGSGSETTVSLLHDQRHQRPATKSGVTALLIA